MKHEWKKHEKELYGAKETPALLDVPLQRYIMMDGRGNPNDADFANRVGALYSLAYAVKMACKAAADKDPAGGVRDYTVYPLEGVWWQKPDGPLVKEALEYSLMIRQPDLITGDLMREAFERVKKKTPNPLLEAVRFDAVRDGLCVEILHVGPFDAEPASFEKMDCFVKQMGRERIAGPHREIYLNNARRTPEDRLRTILRYRVR